MVLSDCNKELAQYSVTSNKMRYAIRARGIRDTHFSAEEDGIIFYYWLCLLALGGFIGLNA